MSLPNLKRLNLGSNEIDEVSPQIERWTHLETLILSRNKVEYRTVRANAEVARNRNSNLPNGIVV